MHRFDIDPKQGFHVLSSTKKSQCATMVIKPGDSEGGPDNKHTGDQWLFVIEGTGRATVEGKHVGLKPGVLIEIEAGETHEIKNDGDADLRTLNFYAPPQY